MNRLFNLDYLRGIAAFGIMVYHYLSWSFGKFEAESAMGRIGIFGVSIFYVLSGLTLYHVYSSRMQFSRADILSFFKKRIFRIFLLLWLATIATIFVSGIVPSIPKLLMNLTGLFGVVAWEDYIALGAWSIGNEIVFYLFFPFFLFCIRKSTWLVLLTLTIVFGIYLYFSFFILDNNNTLSVQWRNYINPLNQLLLFFGGMLIGYLFMRKEITPLVSGSIIILGLVIFVFYPANGNAINLVTGYNRSFFTLSCFLICLGFYKISIIIPVQIHKGLSLLGETSYSIYLLHPLIYIIVGKMFLLFKFDFYLPSSALILTLSVLITICLSFVSYEYFEKYFMRLGSQRKPVIAAELIK